MQIVVYVREVLDPDTRLKLDTVTGAIDERGIPHILNSSDLFAVEEALKIKDRLDDSSVTVITVGPLESNRCLIKCITLGADRAIRIWEDCLQDADAYIESLLLAKAIRKIKCDLFLCGSQSENTPDDIGPFVAELLNMPVVSNVTHIDIALEKNLVTAYRRLERGNRNIIQCNLPAVLTIEKEINEPRYPTLVNRLRALKEEKQVWDLAAAGFDENERGLLVSKSNVQEIMYPKPRMKKTSAPDPNLSVEQRLALLVSGGVVEKKGELIEGTPEVVASKIVDFLVNENII